MRARPVPWFLALALAAIGAAPARAENPELVAFRSGDMTLHGFLWRPAAATPSPALLWNHGSEKLPGSLVALGNRFTAAGYVFFVPHRRGQGRSSDAGPYIMDQLSAMRGPGRGQMIVRLLEEQLADQAAALEFLRARTDVDAARIFAAGCSFGGIETLFAAERRLGYRAGIAFAAGAETWASAPELQRRLREAARNAAFPLWIVQAENDFDTTPGRAIAAELDRAGKPHALTIFPPWGGSAREAHGFCVSGGETWIPDALAFFKRNGG